MFADVCESPVTGSGQMTLVGVCAASGVPKPEGAIPAGASPAPMGMWLRQSRGQKGTGIENDGIVGSDGRGITIGKIENAGSAGNPGSGSEIESEKLGIVGNEGSGITIGKTENVGSAGNPGSGKPIANEKLGIVGSDGSGTVMGTIEKSVKLHELREAHRIQ